MYAAQLRETLPEVRERIAAAIGRRGGGTVTLVAVTKGHPLAAVAAAAAAGLRTIGENRVPELEEKRAALPPDADSRQALAWHLIGHLQRNKVKRALGVCDFIHSVDSERLARELSAEAVNRGVVVRALAQVNVSGEGTKSGFTSAEAIEALARVCTLPGLRIEGLMTMAPLTGDADVLRATFAATRALRDRCASEVAGFAGRELSMGMSNDYEIAIEEGSTMVRLGTVLFGERTG
jgi:hypothetical protein